MMNQETTDAHDKKDKQSLDLAQLAMLAKPIGVFFRRHLVLLFIVLTLSALIYAVLMVNSILQQDVTTNDSSGSAYTTQFDQETIDKIDALNNRDQTPTITLPGGRINPFSE